MNHITTLDRVVVIRDDKETTTSSGLIIPDLDPLVRTDTGLVVAVGPGRTTKNNVVIEVAVAVGDRVMFDSGAGINVRTDGEDLVVLKEDEIIGVIV